MGVSGLLPLLKSIHRPTELKKLAGETLGVDAYGWLHRGAIACALELAQGKPTRKYVDFAMHRVRMLRHFGVTPYLVFDGDFLPSKAMTEGSRAKRRDDSKKLGMELLKAGKHSQAFAEFQKSIDVTPEMARNLIDELNKIHVEYVVAPYEADSQLVYLERQGIIGGILSEDSDLLVFGCKRLLTKLDQYGNCIEINRRDFAACREISLTGWTDAEFRRMAILSGCDYLAGVSNMGLKTAYRMVRQHKTPERLVRMMQFEAKHRVSEDYLANFTKAELTFLYQRVYCPKKKELVFLTEPEEGQGVNDMPFIGAFVEPTIARGVATGHLNPMTKLPIIPAAMPESKPSRTGSNTPTKPIDSYFKNRGRIPMGAMDPNCFSVDPQRVAALTQNGLVPRVFPLPRPYLDEATLRAAAPSTRRVHEPAGALLSRASSSSSEPSRRQSSIIPPTTAAEIDALMMGTTQGPPKKARLCSDKDVDQCAPEAGHRSKFFPKIEKKAARKDSYLFSDDSIDEALMNLPDIDGWRSSDATTTKNSQFSTRDDELANTQTSTVESFVLETQDESQGQSKITEPPKSTPLRSLQSFAYNQTRSATTAGSPASVRSQAASVFTPSTGAPSTAASSVAFSAIQPATQPSITQALKKQNLTPLQRIGERALSRKQMTHNRPRSPKASPKKRNQRNGVMALPVDPSFVPLPKVDLDEVEALNRPVGSEDMIPDSDEENDLDDEKHGSIMGDENSGNASLNLSRFLYA
ncbi:Exodeoxyribonuclease 1 like protein [Verticillium longisporum]|nr:Exodeoxyribonuclease 1 like protein [Verticillium longisporum]